MLTQPPSNTPLARPRGSRLVLLGLALTLSTIGLIDHRAEAADAATEPELQIDITKIGLGKEVVITQGKKEWFMRVEVTPENSVVVRQEKQGERYLLDESEMHDRAMTSAEVDAAITDFINSVKTRQKVK
jgi:metal-sulfur cluster biosynthetic enzyme